MKDLMNADSKIQDPSTLSVQDILNTLDVNSEVGLTTESVASARRRHGSNELPKEDTTGWLGKFFKQFKNPLVIILLIAGIITLAIGEFVDSVVIFVALLVNVIIGTIQEGRASKAFAALEKEQSQEATVIRNGEKQVIPAEEVVVGDIVELDAGMSVPADMRLIQEGNLEVNESALTGEWEAVAKDTTAKTKELPVPDRTNMAWKGTVVTSGEGRGVVTAVGGNTQVGQIASQLTDTETITPIQKHMQQLARFVSIVSLVAVGVIFLLGALRGESLVQMLVFSIAVAVSVVPEGLPAAVTVVLALGMENILKRGGLVRNLKAAETLGSTTVTLTDKTGTITRAEMAVDELIPAAGADDTDDEVNENEVVTSMLTAAVANTDAFVEHNDEGDVVHGEPIEKAIVEYGQENGVEKSAVNEKRRDFIAFRPENRMALSLYEDGDSDRQVYVSGAPEVVLSNADKVKMGGSVRRLSDDMREEITQILSDRSAAGKRVIAVAQKPAEQDIIPRKDEGAPDVSAVSGLTYMGLIVFADPVRSDVADAIKQARTAGVHVVMVTGDNPDTAQHIAQEAGVAEPDAEPVVGSQLRDMPDGAVVEAVRTRNVFARMLPDQKLRIAKLLQGENEVVAMTGDGVNDAPALRAADIGVSVGSGTEVAKEASDLVLLDDSFSIIISAIEEGRRIIDNLKKIIAHLLSASFGELFLIAGALLVGLPIPILTAQILWINIVEGGLLTFVFAAEPPAPDVMTRDPQSARMSNLINNPLRWLIFASGTITGIAAFFIYWSMTTTIGLAIEQIRTLMFVILTIDALTFTLALKNFYQPIFRIDFTNNIFVFISLGLSLLALFGAIYVPPLRNLLSLTTPTLGQWGFLALVAAFDLLVVELAKYWLFQRTS